MERERGERRGGGEGEGEERGMSYHTTELHAKNVHRPIADAVTHIDKLSLN